MIRSYAAFRDGKQVSSGTRSIAEAATSGSGCDFVWLQLDNPSEQEIAEAATAFELPELAVEDAHHKHQRPKVEEYQGSVFIVLRNAYFDSAEHRLVLGEIQIFLGSSYVIVVRHGGDDEDLKQVQDRVDQRPELLAHGPSAIVYAVMDQVVDDYAPVVEDLSSDIERIETEVFTGEGLAVIRETTEHIYSLKREVLEFRKATAPLVLSLERVREGLVRDIPEEVRKYFRDVLDHLMRVSDQVESFRELLTSILEANVALVSVRQNDIVQKISGWAAIIAVPTLISGIYGMNFDHMPELSSRFGYPYALLLMLLLGGSVYALLKRAKWL